MKTFFEDTRHGRFLLIRGDFISDQIRVFGEWSETEVELFAYMLSERSNVIEVGANIGAHTIPLSRICAKGKVIAFEVQRPIFYVLCANISINDRMNVIAKPAAAWDCNCDLEIETCSYEHPWNYGNFSIDKSFSDEKSYPGLTSKDHVSAVRLDDDPHIRALETIDLLKIDAEGAEKRVLDGAKDLINAHKPAIFVEATRRDLVSKIKDDLEKLGYEGFWFISVRGRPDSYFGPANYSDGYASRMEENAIFVHADAALQPTGLRRIAASSCVPPPDLPVLHKYPLPSGESPMFVFGNPTARYSR